MKKILLAELKKMGVEVTNGKVKISEIMSALDGNRPKEKNEVTAAALDSEHKEEIVKQLMNQFVHLKNKKTVTIQI